MIPKLAQGGVDGDPGYLAFRVAKTYNQIKLTRSLSLHMKLRGFRLSFLLLLTGSLAVGAASSQNPPPPGGDRLAPPATPSAAAANPQSAGQPSKSKNDDAAAPAQGSDQQADPLKRPLSEKQKKANAKAAKQELSSTYKKWLNEDVRWIISPEELTAFKQLSNDEERDQFIEQFWLRRDPTPDTPENEYKEEHYRRIAYANEHFAAGIPDGGPIAAAFTSSGARPTRSKPIPPGAVTSGPWKRAGGKPRPIPLRTGVIAISRASARK